MTYNVGDIWKCPVCGRTQEVTSEGVRCYQRGHQSYKSLEYLQGYNANKKKKTNQLNLF